MILYNTSLTINRKVFKMKNLFKWILAKDEKEQKPVWTPYEENEKKYEEIHKQLSMK